MAENQESVSQPSLDINQISEEEVTQNVGDDEGSVVDWASEDLSSTDSDSEDCPLNERFCNPSKYFQELDNLQLYVLENSPSLQFLTVTKPYVLEVAC